MDWNFSLDPEAFSARASDLLLADPVRNTISAVGMERWAVDGAPDGSFFGWCQDRSGAVVGAVSMNPPWPLLLDRVPEECLPSLIDALRTDGRPVTGVNAAVPLAVTFAAMWTARTQTVAQLFMATRLFELGDLAEPRHVAPGSARRADEGDLDLLVEWMNGFLEDIHEQADDSEESMRARLRTGEVWLWNDASGQPVSMVGRTPPAAGVARVGPVYTPPRHRGRGFAEALTHAVCARARGQGMRLVLFADQANPTSTGIYRSLGFAPVQDRIALRFVPSLT
jgi:GNAT superfamily N-acetyltransferase